MTQAKIFVTNKALIPEKGSKGAAGYDLKTANKVSIWPGSSVLVGTGVRVVMPENWVGIIKSRSGLAVKKNIEVGAGVIDSDYRGEIKVLLRNLSEEGPPVVIPRYSRIAQLLFFKIPKGEIEIIHTTNAEEFSRYLNDSERGENGFGSTGL